MNHPNTDSTELEKLIGPRCKTTDKQDFPDVDYSDPKASRCFSCETWEAIDAYTADKQKDLLDSLHREIFSDAGVMDIVEIAKLLRDKKESL